MISQILTNELFIQLVVFGGLAVVRTLVVDIIGWRLLVSWMGKNPWSWEYVTKIKLNVYSYSHGISFVVSSITSYYLNRYITFSSPTANSETRVFVEFMSVSIITLLISVLLINILTSNKPILALVQKSNLLRNYWPMVAKLLTIGFVMVINFVGYKFIVFK